MAKSASQRGVEIMAVVLVVLVGGMMAVGMLSDKFSSPDPSQVEGNGPVVVKPPLPLLTKRELSTGKVTPLDTPQPRLSGDRCVGTYAVLSIDGTSREYGLLSFTAPYRFIKLSPPAELLNPDQTDVAGSATSSNFWSVKVSPSGEYCLAIIPAGQKWSGLVVWRSATGEIVWRDLDPAREINFATFCDDQHVLFNSETHDYSLLEKINILSDDTRVLVNMRREGSVDLFRANPLLANNKFALFAHNQNFTSIDLARNKLSVWPGSPDKSNAVVTMKFWLPPDSSQLLRWSDQKLERWSVGPGKLEGTVLLNKIPFQDVWGIFPEFNSIVVRSNEGFIVWYDWNTGEIQGGLQIPPAPYRVEALGKGGKTVLVVKDKPAEAFMVEIPASPGRIVPIGELLPTVVLPSTKAATS